MVSFSRYCRITFPSAFVNSFFGTFYGSSVAYIICCAIGLYFLFMLSLLFGIQCTSLLILLSCLSGMYIQGDLARLITVIQPSVPMEERLLCISWSSFLTRGTTDIWRWIIFSYGGFPMC